MDYYLVDNSLTPDPTDSRAVVISKGTKTRADIIEGIVNDNVGLSGSELLAVFEAEKKVVSEFVEAGYSINTELFAMSASMRGVFHDVRETYTPGKHRLHLNFLPGKTLTEALKRVVLRKVTPNKNVPLLSVIEDVVSGTTNEQITPGKAVRIFGDKLTFDATDATQGVFLVDEKGKATRANEYIELSKKKIYAGMPDTLKAGNYTLQVVTKTKAGEARVGRLDYLLAVD